MVNLEHIRLLETRISKAIDYVKKINDENALLKGKLGSYQTRIDELEILIQQFKEEQSRIEDGILSALDRLNQFEDALESKLAEKAPAKKEPKPIPKAAKPESVHSGAAIRAQTPPDPEPAPDPIDAGEDEPADEVLHEDSETDFGDEPLEDGGELDIF